MIIILKYQQRIIKILLVIIFIPIIIILLRIITILLLLSTQGNQPDVNLLSTMTTTRVVRNIFVPSYDVI